MESHKILLNFQSDKEPSVKTAGFSGGLGQKEKWGDSPGGVAEGALNGHLTQGLTHPMVQILELTD